MNEDKKFKKIKTIFTVEYLLIAVVVLVIAILKLTGVMPNSKNRLLVYNIITTLGGIFILVTLTICSEMKFSVLISVSPKLNTKPLQCLFFSIYSSLSHFYI